LETDRLVTSWRRPEDWDVETSLRPRTLAEYVGQRKVKEHMELFIHCRQAAGESL